MDGTSLERYLSSRLGAPLRIVALSQAFPGLSRETWLVDFEAPAVAWGNLQGVVVRVDTPGGPFPPVPLEYEYKVYATLAGTGIPVARALWFDAAPEPSAGRALFVREKIDGSTMLPGLGEATPEAAQRRRRVAFEHMEKLAKLHRLDWRLHGFDRFMAVPASVADAPRHELMTWWQTWERVRTAPFPLVTAALGWFRAHLPPAAARLSLCKGQNGIGEELWRDDRIVALCDWELAHIGDPCQDLALSQGMLKLADPEETIAHYEAAAGFSLPRANLDYYIVWNAFKSLLALNNGLNGFLDGRYRRLARASLGYGKVQIYERMLASIIDMDVHAAARFVLSGQTTPYQNRRVAGG